MQEFRALDSNDATRILSDAGLAKADLREIMSRPFAMEDLLSRGMESVGIDPDEFAVRNADWYQNLQRNCALCRLRGRCRRIILRSEFARRYREFCPNNGDFDQILAAMARGSSPSGGIRQRDPEAKFPPDSGYLDYVI
jgi:hypothetical protein